MFSQIVGFESLKTKSIFHQVRSQSEIFWGEARENYGGAKLFCLL